MNPRLPLSRDTTRDDAQIDIRSGVIIALIFLSILLAWSVLARLDAGAYAQGEVAVLGSSQSVQHRDGGIVSKLKVAEGDHVTQGQALIDLSSAEALAAERAMTAQVFGLLAQRARLRAEQTRSNTIPLPHDFLNLSPEDQTLSEEAMRLQRQQFAARHGRRSSETNILDQRTRQLVAEAQGLERQITSHQEQAHLISEELAGMRRLLEQGYAPLTRVRALERTAAALEGEQAALSAQLVKTRAAISEAAFNQGGVSLRLDEDVAEQLKQVDVELNNLRPRLSELKAQLERHIIRAPTSGRVVDLKIFTNGGVIQPGQTLMRIVPDRAQQVIVARVKPADVDNVQPGLDTRIQFASLRDRTIPVVIGKVKQVSAETLIADNDRSSEAYYRAEIVVEENELKKLGPSAQQLRPGMPVEVVIVTRKRSLLQYLFEPLTRNLFRSGSEA